MTDNTVVMLTALNLEYEAVRQKLVDPGIHRHERGTRFEVGALPRARCRVALGLTGKGNHSAAVLAERAMHEFSPKLMMFVGVAGALRESAQLGDVVMATHIYAYHGGTSEDDGLKARPRVWEVAHEISQIASHLGRTGDWADRIPPGDRAPQLHFGAIAAGEVVQNSQISYQAEWIRNIYNDALAIEMEAAGVAQAGHLNGSPVAVIRGISDRADGTKTTETDADWQPAAAANAAALAVRLAEELTSEWEQAAMHDANSARGRGTAATGSVVNNNTAGQVGIQAGTVIGSNVSMSAQPTPEPAAGLITKLDELRASLTREHAAGNLRDDEFAAAQAELDTAGKALEGDAPQATSTLVLALKRLRGLVGDLAEPAAKVAAFLAAAQGLS
ncbi:5'-methylthioadenosine/S-adenosylhomocysteine nucleosidase [Streptomonospora sp. PA3]|uniref:5'-methylthioadenosine/S-adenosylhomocysteine nucleosidase family protein n=1 Tax=Streptomonospora sp. PA3 TaxID=2607326 RepID=UPI0012DC7239|nr:5'-methylthioadenosine/S-adenosylhomocysteine nucleosidase [Streptomonospora sp. PA3]MUL41951.1 5'-methylthioadenosine/S-adenosylhomocysteine nucleosidase [Streptomonospora sp. PA3]